MLNGALPSFDLAEGGLMLAFVRSLSVLALFSAYGTLLFRVFVFSRAFDRMPAEQAARIDRQLRQIIWISLAVDGLALIVWLVIEAGILADMPDLSGSLSAIGPVLWVSAFGHVILMQLAAALAIAVALGRGRTGIRWHVAAGLSIPAMLLQAGHSHALAMGHGLTLLLVSVGVHLLSAGAWIGGLFPLLLVVREASPKAGATVARHFSPLGKLCLYGLVASAACQGWALLGGIPGVIGTPYGWMAIVKAALFLVLFGFAWINRYHLAPALLSKDQDGAKRALVRSIAVQTGFGLAVVVAAGILSSLPPGLHTQPIWPFQARPSLVTIQEDADFRREAVGAVLMLSAALGLLAFGVAIRRLRWLASALAGIIIWFAVPHLDLLFVEAYPTSFYHSPTNFAATGIADGASLFPGQCAACHGPKGRGDGPNASDLPEPPADLTAAHLWGHSDGELFWWLSHGIEAPNGGFAMPGFASVLNENQRWHLIDYLRAHNAGLVQAATGNWPQPIRAPEFTVSCVAANRITLADLRGKFLRIVFADVLPPPLRQTGVEIVTIAVPPENKSISPSAESCVAANSAIRVAYGVVSGIPPDRMNGLQFVVDPNGWLRALRRGNDEGLLADPDALLTVIEQISRHPIDDDQGGSSAHHHPS